MSLTDSKHNDLLVRRHIGEKIKQQRKSLNMNQAGVAQHLGISAQQFYKYEKGVDQIPLGKLLELSKFFQVSPDFFYQGLEGFKTSHRELTVMCKNEEGKQFSLRLIDDDHIFSEIKVIEKNPQSNQVKHEET